MSDGSAVDRLAAWMKANPDADVSIVWIGHISRWSAGLNKGSGLSSFAQGDGRDEAIELALDAWEKQQ